MERELHPTLFLHSSEVSSPTILLLNLKIFSKALKIKVFLLSIRGQVPRKFIQEILFHYINHFLTRRCGQDRKYKPFFHIY